MSDHQPTRAERAAKLMDDHRSTSNRRRLATTLMVVIAVAACVFGAQRLLSSGEEPVEAADTPQHASKDFGFRLTPALVNDDDQSEPAVTVAVYEDFQCPSCAVFKEDTGDFLREAVSSGRIVLEYRPFTFLADASTNRYTSRAANAAACVADATGVVQFAKFHDLAFAKQPDEGGPGPEDDTLIAWAEKAGASDVDSCIRDERFADWVNQAVTEGRDRGVSQTPTVAINESILSVSDDDGGTRLPEADDIERAIKRSGR